MSNTESSAITRLISEAQSPRLEPYKPTTAPSAAAAAQAQRLARGTIAPHQPVVAQPSVAPGAWYQEPEELVEELIEDADDDENVPVAVRTDVAPANPWHRGDETPLPAVLIETGEADLMIDDDGPEVVGMAPLPRPVAAPLPKPRPRAAAAGTPAPARTAGPQLTRNPRPSAAIVAPLPTPFAAQNIQSFEPTPRGDSENAWADESLKPRRGVRTTLWLALAGALAVGGYFGVTELRARQEEQAANADAPATAPLAMAAPALAPAPAVEPVVAPAAAQAAPSPAPTAAVDAVAATAGFELPGIAVDTRVVFDGKPLGMGPMRVLRLAPGAHKLELIAANGAPAQVLPIELAPDTVTPITLPTAEPVVAEPAKEAEVAKADEPKADEAKADEAKADEPKADEPKAEKKSRHERTAERAAPKVAPKSHGRKHDDDDDDDKKDVEDKHPARASSGKDNGTLLVNAKPPCEIIIDGKPTGLSTPQRDLELEPGTHTVLLVNSENRIKKTAKVKVSAGKPTRLVVDLTDQMR